jgi:ankyrin repeat protein
MSLSLAFSSSSTYPPSASQVRSLTLDAWDAELLELFRELGNEKANAIFAACLPSTTAPLHSQADRAERERFIRDKYVRRLFVSEEGTRKNADGEPLDGNASLYDAVARDCFVDVLHSLACGANVNYQEPGDKRTPLHVAMANENFVMSEFLFQNGASGRRMGDDGLFVLFFCYMCVCAVVVC